MKQKETFLCIDLKSFYASVECVERGLDPFTTNLVVADPDLSLIHIFDASYFHLVFTVPDILNPIIYNNQKLLYDTLYHAASATISEMCIRDSPKTKL